MHKDKLKRLSFEVTLALSGESKKSLNRFFDGHKPTKNRAHLSVPRRLRWFNKKSLLQRVIFNVKHR